MYLPKHYRRLKRAPQVILPKDIGIIFAYSGVNRNSSCIDAGTGSGWLAISLARVAKRVVSYEIREDFAKLAERNRINEGLDNLEIKNLDFKAKVEEKNFDLVVLDMPEAHNAIKNAKGALRDGGMLVGYMPQMEQVKKFVSKMERMKFTGIITFEVILRDMLVRKEGMRPSTKGVWHTAYLVFGEKTQKIQIKN